MYYKIPLVHFYDPNAVILLLVALLIASGCCIYPNGWSSREIRDVCGPESDAYRLGKFNMTKKM